MKTDYEKRIEKMERESARLHKACQEQGRKLAELQAMAEGAQVLLDKLLSENKQLKAENRQLKTRLAELEG